MLALTALLLMALAIAAPLVGEDSRVVDVERREPWWPGARNDGSAARGRSSPTQARGSRSLVMGRSSAGRTAESAMRTGSPGALNPIRK